MSRQSNTHFYIWSNFAQNDIINFISMLHKACSQTRRISYMNHLCSRCSLLKPLACVFFLKKIAVSKFKKVLILKETPSRQSK